MPDDLRSSSSHFCGLRSAASGLRFQALVILVSLAALPGCSTFSMVRRSPTPPARVESALFVADGAGNFQAFSKTLRDVAYREKGTVYVHTFEWSHGHGRILADQLGFVWAREAGIVLARDLEDFREKHPGCRILLLGHSAGSTVILSALEHVRPGVVDRAMLIAPSVSARYDLEPALRKVKGDLHVFYSRHDWCYLGLATQVVGTQDRRWLAPASGRVGFRFQPEGPDAEILRSKLKQHPWTPRDGETGNLGGHFGAYQPEFLRRNILPLTLDLSRDLPDEPDETVGEEDW